MTTPCTSSLVSCASRSALRTAVMQRAVRAWVACSKSARLMDSDKLPVDKTAFSVTASAALSASLAARAEALSTVLSSAVTALKAGWRAKAKSARAWS